jgi:hypothetical protein
MWTVDETLWASVWGTDEQRVAYWTELQEPWWGPEFELHDRIMANPAAACPMRTHGDDGAFKKGLVRLSMMIFSVSSGLTWQGSAFSTILLVFGLAMQFCSATTFDECLAVVSWSIDACIDGHWPKQDHQRKDLEGWRAEKAGDELADGKFAIPVQHLGDLKFMREAFHHGSHYGKDQCCHLCGCRKSQRGVGNFANFTAAGVEWFIAHMESTQQFLAGFGDHCLVPHLARHKGFSVFMWLVDFMHSDLQGVFIIIT